MAKIFIQGQPDVDCPRDEAIKLQQQWIAEKGGQKGWLEEILEVGGRTFESKKITGFDIEIGNEEANNPEYDLFDEAQKAKVKAFMREFDDWKAQHPEITEWQQWEYMQAKGAIKMGKHRPDDEVLNVGLFRELQKLFSSRQTLIYYREKAQANNDPDYEAKRVEIFQRIKEKTFGKRTTTNPALEKLNADAKEFDRTHQIDEYRDVRPEDIPF